MSLILDRKQFDRFVALLPSLQKDEVYFLSLSCRNKYLSEREREQYQIGRTEMFGRTLARSKEDYIQKMNDLYHKYHARKTKNDLSIPYHALVCYANINPSSMVKAYNMFMTDANKQIFDAFEAEQENKQANYEGIRMLDRLFMNSVQKARSRKFYIDIDIDTKEGWIFQKFEEELKKEPEIVFSSIETHGGYHVLIKSSTIPHGFNLGKMVQDAHAIAQRDYGKEVVFNKNQMVPIPGTSVSNFLIKFVE